MERYSDEVALLVAQTGPLNGQRWAVRDSILIGREPVCDIVIPDRQVSRHHARFSASPLGITVEDLGSKNGTHLNGELIHQPALLQDGDIVQVALAQQFVFLSSDATIPLDYDDIEMAGQAHTGGGAQPAGAAHGASAAPSANAGGGAIASPILPSFPHRSRLRLEKRSRRVWVREAEVVPPLSVSQFHLLEILYEHQGRVVTRQEMIAEVWGQEQAVDVSEQALDALVRRLRDRLASIDPTHAYIVTVRGHGLRLDNPPYNT